ncbi:hypothetical protein HELRODRAFT_169559 [Helobdella robusta]|uniref:Uncharacterized protein n=1 Tax=Helobdella robusta TaxID=6412 RepID=T1F235_HELRO|nr:hypothetical protein HELRODRAFT_169559 [Helobdella robusta]ESO07864.1 hypothetical protein HELRODRAFT_169559 [Helobdella robusta]
MCKSLNSAKPPEDPEENLNLSSSPTHQQTSPPTSASTNIATTETQQPSSPPHQQASSPSPTSQIIVKTEVSLPGIKLPKTTAQWVEANAYFQSQRTALPNIVNINNFTANLQSLIYNYFASTYGTLKQKTNSTTKSDIPTNKLKSELKQLKLLGRNNHNFDTQIITLSRQIRAKISSSKASKIGKILDITSQLKNKFWPTCEKLLKPTCSLLPMFNVEKCKEFFHNILNDPCRNKYCLPNWIQTLPNPSIACNINPPTYNEIFSIIRKCKSRASPCPLDQMSIIILKKCPILRTILHQLLVEYNTSYPINLN